MSASGHQLVGGFFVGLQIGVIGFGGRKDAFPGADGSTITQATGTNQNAETIPLYGADGMSALLEGSMGVKLTNIATEGVLSGNNTILYAIQYPLSFIYSNPLPKDWYTDNESYQNSTLWNGTIKSIYDPCPKGWCIPQDGTWADFTVQNFIQYKEGISTTSDYTNVTTAGRLYNHISWYASGGIRSCNSGKLIYVGYHGSYWSSTPNGSSIRALGFYIDIYPSGIASRANGTPVRCVQE